ncbi:MAG: hypothetical protein AAF074_13115, partial [Pseudomonadota bacterium]
SNAHPRETRMAVRLNRCFHGLSQFSASRFQAVTGCGGVLERNREAMRRLGSPSVHDMFDGLSQQ